MLFLKPILQYLILQSLSLRDLNTFFFSAWTHFFCPVLNKMNKKTPTGGKKENKTPPETPQKCNDFSEIVTFIWYKQTLL